ncbi:cytochrome P450 4C1-like [Pectinophora gossypiella]|uniref:cytochrome P450 4C1-like n=1 Tax=Pectinophora gossypiella TaxID=13191 RepID=UPI00214F360B|nr:cytochrome P450 4C1-like [Pectinophora gossypiella]
MLGLSTWQVLLCAAIAAVVAYCTTVTSTILEYAWWWRDRVRARRRLVRLAARMPGPPAWPLLGNALVFMASPQDQLNIITGFFEKYGPYVRFWLGPDLNICIKDPADIRMLLTSNKINQKGPLYEFMKQFIGPGILTGGPTWRNHRKIATPSYNKKCVVRFAKVFNREAQVLAEALLKKDPGRTFDVYHDVVACTTQCVCQTLMGLSKEDSTNVKRMEELVYKTQTIYSFIFTKMTHWWLQIPLIFSLTGRKKIGDEYLRLLDDFSSDVVAKRRRAMKESPVVDEETLGVVDRFLLSGEMSDREVKWETFTLFTTSQEASAKIAAGVLLILAHLPEWQDKVHDEILELLGPVDCDVTEEELKKLHCLDMVYKETLRYLSIAAFIQRTVEEEVTVKNGELTLPSGASVIIPIHMLHRDPHYWRDPYKVDPARFLPETVRERDPNAFVPFSLGAMDCLGRVYATSLIKTLVVRVLRKVQLEADGNIEDLDLNVAISVKFADGYNLRARPRV